MTRRASGPMPTGPAHGHAPRGTRRVYLARLMLIVRDVFENQMLYKRRTYAYNVDAIPNCGHRPSAHANFVRTSVLSPIPQSHAPRETRVLP